MQPNPFEFDAANRFTVDEMVDLFITDDNFTRFLASRKNVFLLGDRGTGKTMALRFYSLQVQSCLNQRPAQHPGELLDLVGIYIPCRKPDLGKTEPELLEPFLGRLTGEHLLVTAMIFNLADSLHSVKNLVTAEEESKLREEIPLALQWESFEEGPIFQALGKAAKRESIQAQRALNRREADSHYENLATFSTAFQPLIDILTSTVLALKNSHFSLMFDDAEDLSDYQNETLNSWIAVRDTSRLSFKVASSAVDQRPLKTVSGGGLLERHDFLRVDLEQDFQNSDAAYGQLARKIVNRRLQHFNIPNDADNFFPPNPAFTEGLLKAKEKAHAEAIELGLKDRQIRDYVNKMERAIYFRDRPPQANRPPYSGFDLLVHVSTGVIRYLLEPCYEMYDKALSADAKKAEPIKKIPPAIQTECLELMSKRRWEWIGRGFNSSVKGCTREDATHIHHLLNQLAVLYKHRLQKHNSEPRAISFSVSAWQNITSQQADDLNRIFRVARRAQILFQRLSTGKDEGQSDTYYTFDRLLWIERGLDPVGQNARVSIEARYLWEAAFEDKALPFGPKDKQARDNGKDHQLKIFEGDKP
jgi:hypothetical protein